MSWYHRIFRRPRPQEDAVRLLHLRCTRFRQLVRNYGRILDAAADAAEKQAGNYILDRQYLVSLSEVGLDRAEAVIFDLNVLAGQHHDAFYPVLDRFRSQIRRIIPAAEEPGRIPNAAGAEDHESRISPAVLNTLADAIAASQVLYRHGGQVACRGVAAGPIFNLQTEPQHNRFPRGAVMVARDIQPDDELIRLMRQASAILTDLGEAVGETATLARDFRIPTIVGLGDASVHLTTGNEITVDADENIVYQGRIQELLDYYQSERLGVEEEREYRILREIRRLLFSLTLNEDSGPASDLGDCRTLHDLVHLAHDLAGEAYFDLTRSLQDVRKRSHALETGFDIPFYVIDAGFGLAPSETVEEGLRPAQIQSLPLRLLLQGMDQRYRNGTAGDQEPVLSAGEALATVTEEYANLVIRQHGGFDIVDSMIGDSRESNHIYCRFAAADGGNANPAVRGLVAREIMSRLDFAAARTSRAAAGWLGGIPRSDMEERLTIVGRLVAQLLLTDAAGWDAVSQDTYVDSFIAQHV
jgi:pyruvate,water dikinase